MADAKDNKIGLILKAVELLLAVLCTALTDGMMLGMDLQKNLFINVIFCGYILILLMDISRMLLSEKMATQVEMFWSFVGGILWITAGALEIELYDNTSKLLPKNFPQTSEMDKLIATGVMGLVNGLLFLVDAVILLNSA